MGWGRNHQKGLGRASELWDGLEATGELESYGMEWEAKGGRREQIGLPRSYRKCHETLKVVLSVWESKLAINRCRIHDFINSLASLLFLIYCFARALLMSNLGDEKSLKNNSFATHLINVSMRSIFTNQINQEYDIRISTTYSYDLAAKQR